MFRPCLTASVLCLFGAGSAANAELSYSYVDGAVAATSTDSTLGEQDGLAGDVVLSYELLDLLHVFGGYEYTELDDFPIDGELTHAGVGVHFAPSEHASVYFNLAALTTELDVVTGLGTLRADEEG
jgi:hypothetical protein